MFDFILNWICRRRQGYRIVPHVSVSEQPPGANVQVAVAQKPVTRCWHQPFLEKLMALSMTATQQANLSVTITDRKGNPATVHDPTWMTDNTDLLLLTPAGDGLSCLVVAKGPVGDGVVTFAADADLGGGIQLIGGTLDVSITSAFATTVVISAGAPVEQP